MHTAHRLKITPTAEQRHSDDREKETHTDTHRYAQREEQSKAERGKRTQRSRLPSWWQFNVLTPRTGRELAREPANPSLVTAAEELHYNSPFGCGTREKESKKKKSKAPFGSAARTRTHRWLSRNLLLSLSLSLSATERRVKWNKPLAKVVIDSCCPLAARTRTAPGFHYFPPGSTTCDDGLRA